MVHLPLSETFEAEIRSLSTTIRGTTHNGIGGSRTATSDHTRVSTTTRASRVQRPKSNKLTNFQLPRILVESTNRCTMQWQEHTKCSSPSLSNSNTATNANGGIRVEEQRGETPRTPRSRSTRFPSLRGGMDWWKCRSRSPLSNPSKICNNHGRKWERGKLCKVNNGGGERKQLAGQSWLAGGRWRGIYTPPR